VLPISLKVLAAIFCITALEIVALCKGIDGYLFGIVIAALAGLAGYEIKVWKDKKEE